MEDIAPIVMLGSYVAFIVYEALRPARRLPPVRWWRLKGFLFFVMTAAISIVLPLAWGDFATRHALLHLSSLGTWGGAAVGYLTFQLLNYWWHRAQHTVPLIWRFTHQIHHSAERVDIWGVLLFHPFDVVAFAGLSAGVYSLLLGLAPSAVALASVYGIFASFLQHANIRTPRWLGYIVQRPESHGVHHGRGIHRYNYSDLPLWDMAFGTLRNPGARETPVSAGFYHGGSARLSAMLAFREP